MLDPVLHPKPKCQKIVLFELLSGSLIEAGTSLLHKTAGARTKRSMAQSGANLRFKNQFQESSSNLSMGKCIIIMCDSYFVYHF